MFPHSVSSVRNQVSVLIWWRCHTLRWEHSDEMMPGLPSLHVLALYVLQRPETKVVKVRSPQSFALRRHRAAAARLLGCCCSKDSGKVYIDGRRSTWLLLRFLFTPHFPGGHCCNFPLCEGRCCRRSNTVPAHCSGWLIFFKILFVRMWHLTMIFENI